MRTICRVVIYRFPRKKRFHLKSGIIIQYLPSSLFHLWQNLFFGCLVTQNSQKQQIFCVNLGCNFRFYILGVGCSRLFVYLCKDSASRKQSKYYLLCSGEACLQQSAGGDLTNKIKNGNW